MDMCVVAVIVSVFRIYFDGGFSTMAGYNAICADGSIYMNQAA